MIDKKLRDHQNCCSSSWRGPWMSVPNSMAIHPNFVKTVPSKPSTNAIRFNPLGTMNVCTTHRGTPSNRHGWSSQYTPSELFVRCLNSCSVILNVTCRDLKDLHPGLGFVYEDLWSAPKDLKTAQNYTDTHTHVLQVEGNVPSSPQGQCVSLFEPTCCVESCILQPGVGCLWQTKKEKLQYTAHDVCCKL